MEFQGIEVTLHIHHQRIKSIVGKILLPIGLISQHPLKYLAAKNNYKIVKIISDMLGTKVCDKKFTRLKMNYK